MTTNMTALNDYHNGSVSDQRNDGYMQGEEAFGAHINIAGRQRMLSQRVGLLLLGLMAQKSDTGNFPIGMISQMEEALREFDQGHSILLNGSAEQGIPAVSSSGAKALLAGRHGMRVDPIARFRKETAQFVAWIQRGEELSTGKCLSLTDFILGDLLDFLQKVVKTLQADFGELMERTRAAATQNMQRVNQAVREIQEAAHYSRMIALNAKISAERAGEFGREFGALTNEIKDISERITSSSKDILKFVSQSDNKPA